ncbi:MAG: AtpZ/AtpI family protein [Lachnospiraceae bacterium]|nr:AtpZ/AtpI family protein [Lachnospiraceae bacterium]
MNKNRSIYKALAMVTQFGINMMVPIVLCVVIGIKADEWLGTSFIVIIMFFLGAAAGFRNIYILSKDIYGDDKERRKKH